MHAQLFNLLCITGSASVAVLPGRTIASYVIFSRTNLTPIVSFKYVLTVSHIFSLTQKICDALQMMSRQGFREWERGKEMKKYFRKEEEKCGSSK